jgi:hypothetical protein
LDLLITINQILVAGVAITAFSLLLYSLTFNLRERVARSFSLILVFLVIVYTTDSLASVASLPSRLEFWLRVQWIGIIFLPPSYLLFSDAVLATTGKPSRGKRRWSTRISYLISVFFLVALPMGWLVGPLVEHPTAPYLQPTRMTDAFILYYVIAMLMSGYNFIRAFFRSPTSTGRRRMGYLLVGALAPALGSFPFLLFTSGFAGRHALIFWLAAVITNFAVGGLVVVMAYSVAFFGVSLPDRRVKARLFKWILRGPVVASITLGIVTIVRRAGEAMGVAYSTFVPITMVVLILIGEHLISVFFPEIERWLFFGNDKDEIEILIGLEDRLVTRNDLRQFIELILSRLCDRLQVPGAFVAAIDPEGLELVVKVGRTFFDHQDATPQLSHVIAENGNSPQLFQRGEDILVPLHDQNEDGEINLLGVLGISNGALEKLDDEELEVINTISEKIAMALKDRRLQEQVFKTLQELSSQAEYIQEVRAAGNVSQAEALVFNNDFAKSEVSQWVKDALSHYWGGPKLTENPLLKLRIVQEQLENNEGSSANALRSVLRQGIERMRPEGERRFTGEWILYNILAMKFLEGKKVREIAMRLAMSEADLYRKQRVAIEAVAKEIMEMEAQNGTQNGLQ